MFFTLSVFTKFSIKLFCENYCAGQPLYKIYRSAGSFAGGRPSRRFRSRFFWGFRVFRGTTYQKQQQTKQKQIKKTSVRCDIPVLERSSTLSLDKARLGKVVQPEFGESELANHFAEHDIWREFQSGQLLPRYHQLKILRSIF